MCHRIMCLIHRSSTIIRFINLYYTIRLSVHQTCVRLYNYSSSNTFVCCNRTIHKQSKDVSLQIHINYYISRFCKFQCPFLVFRCYIVKNFQPCSRISCQCAKSCCHFQTNYSCSRNTDITVLSSDVTVNFHFNFDRSSSYCCCGFCSYIRDSCRPCTSQCRDNFLFQNLMQLAPFFVHALTSFGCSC